MNIVFCSFKWKGFKTDFIPFPYNLGLFEVLIDYYTQDFILAGELG